MPRMRQDPTFKDIFAYPFMVEELVRWLLGDLHGAGELLHRLDFAGLARLPEQSTAGPAGDKRARANDIVWRIPLRGRRGRDRGWLHLVLMLEVQGRVDHLMALRIRGYVDSHHLELWRGRYFGAADRLAPVLPVVLHTGPHRWTAAARVVDLVTPAPAGDPGPGPAAPDGALFAGDGYLLLDTSRLDADDLRHDNAAALLAGLCNPTLERLPAQAAALRARLDAPELRPLLEVALLWAQRTAERRLGFDMGAEDMAEVDRLHEAGELEEYFAARRRAIRDKYRNEGIERGIERGVAAERSLLRRQAARKFGAGADARLGAVLADIASTDLLATVGEWIIDCGTLEELLARCDGLA